MPHSLMIPALSALALAGSGLGIYLGRSAVSEINPAYYASAAEDRWHADLSPNRSVPSEAWSPPATALSAAELGQALGRGCIGCSGPAVEYYQVHRPGDDGDQRDWAAMEAAPTAVRDQMPAAALPPSEAELAAQASAEAAHQAALVAVHRYSNFEVSEPSSSSSSDEPAAQLASVGLPVQE